MVSAAGVAATRGIDVVSTFDKVSMASAAGVAATKTMFVTVIHPKVSIASAAGVAATSSLHLAPRVAASQWPLRPVSLRLWRYFSHTRQALATHPAATSQRRSAF